MPLSYAVFFPGKSPRRKMTVSHKANQKSEVTPPMYEDKTLICKDCGAEFVFTAGEQEFYASKGFTNEPQRCKACRDNRKKNVKSDREMFDAVCAECGQPCKVPFQPREDGRPVYCSNCFAAKRG